MSRWRSSEPSTRSGHRRGASVTVNSCRSRMATARGLRCKPLGGHRSIPTVSHGRETTSTPRDQRKDTQWSRVAMDVLTLIEAIADRQETSTSSWKNSRDWEPSAASHEQLSIYPQSIKWPD